MMNRVEMNEKMMEAVAGGTFTPNKYEEYAYNCHGITTKYHTFAEDEFWLPNGTKTNVDGANAYMDSLDCDSCKSHKRWD